MNAGLILDELSALGLSVTVQGERLVVRPKERLTDELRRRIAENKAGIVGLISGRDEPLKEGPPNPDEMGRVKCFYCFHLDLSAIGAVCRKSKQEKMGISLLTECSDFIMRTLH